MQQGELISAIATAPGESGIGIIRISGKGAVDLAKRCFVPFSGKNISEYAPRQAVYGKVTGIDGQLIDEAICIIMPAPHSYTCEDIVEIQSHGGSVALREILELTYKLGARAAERGEFTKRAFLNGRLDLTQAQAVMDVIQAPTKASLKLATGHLSGHFSGKIREMRNDILALIAHLEASIDFPEDDIEDVAISETKAKAAELQGKIQKMLKSAHTGKILREGLKTAIIGKPNAGKSSIMNLLLREQRAIVTDVAGTTRDSIEETVNIGGVPLVLIDTAGIRETDDVVEKIGVERAKEYIDKASLILAVFDSSRRLDHEDEEIAELIRGNQVIALLNKSDLQAETSCDDVNALLASQNASDESIDNNLGISTIQVSAANGEGLEALEKAIQDIAYEGNNQEETADFVNDSRQAELLRQAEEFLQAATDTIESGMSEDFIVIDLRSAWEKLGEITGETVGEDIIDQIFKNFCLGK